MKKLQNKTKNRLVLIADDDDDDREMYTEAFLELNAQVQLAFVQNGQQLLDYLEGSGSYSIQPHPRPDLILLDLNMPRLDGREALQIIKENPKWASIPVLVISTSHSEADISRTYAMGGNSFITKPSTYREIAKMVQSIYNFWFQLVQLP